MPLRPELVLLAGSSMSMNQPLLNEEPSHRNTPRARLLIGGCKCCDQSLTGTEGPCRRKGIWTTHTQRRPREHTDRGKRAHRGKRPREGRGWSAAEGSHLL